jgi:hypothetical protein
MTWVLIGILTVTTALLAWRIWHLQGLVTHMRTELAGLVDAAVLRAPDAAALLGSPRPTLITIEIFNHFELAKNENRFAGPAAAVAPTLLRQEVTRQAAQRVREELVLQGVKGEVRVVRGA